MSNTANVLRDKGARGDWLHQAQCIISMCLQICDQTLGQRVWPGGRWLQWNSSWKQYVLPHRRTAGVGLSSPLRTVFCRRFSNCFGFPLPPLQPLWHKSCATCGPSSQSVGQECYFPLCLPTRPTFPLQGDTLRRDSKGLSCLPSGEWQAQTYVGFLVPVERACLLWPGRCAGTAGLCLGVGNLTGTSVGCSNTSINSFACRSRM